MKNFFIFIFFLNCFATIQSSPVSVTSGGTAVTSLTAYAVLCGGTTSTGVLQSIASVGTTGQALISAGAGALPAFGTLSVAGGGTGVTSIATGSIVIGATTSPVTPLAIGTSGFRLTSNGTTPGWTQNCVAQTAYTSTAALQSCTTAIPNDDTIPQNTEGDEVLTLTITPKNTANILDIYFTTFGTCTAAGAATIALFQDSTANALAAGYINLGLSDGATVTKSYGELKYRMAAGTTSSTTFKIRIGSATGNFDLNGIAGSRRFGGVAATTFSIVEYSL